MSNTPINPLDPPPPEKGPWIYSGASQPTPSYTPPSTPPKSAAAPPSSEKTSAPPPPGAPTENPLPAPLRVENQESKIENRKSKIEIPDDDTSLGSIVDTIEAVIIALILALTFRAFIIEAFVIPTGSMAPTLLGAHFNVICPKCGYAFTRDADLNYQLIDGEIRLISGGRGELTSNSTVPCDGDDTASLICPNCQYVIPYKLLPQYLKPDGFHPYPDVRRGRDARPREVPFAWANNGDRILVLKYIYSIHDPSRWDVIVFKEPMNAQDNYIKRLIGLPGETVEIIGGDIYVTPPDGNPKDPTQRLIRRKPVHIQDHLWQLVYDNDYYPIDEGPAAANAGKFPRSEARSEKNLPDYFAEWHNPWIGQGDTRELWNKQGLDFPTVGGPAITYRGKGPGSIQFNPSHKTPHTFNVLGYNNDIQELYRPGPPPNLVPVGDLRLETVWTPRDSSGQSVSLTVGTRRNLFRVAWTADGLELFRFNPATGLYQSMDKKTAPEQPRAGQAYRIALNNVDHSVQFFIGGHLVLQHDTPWCAADALREQEEINAVLGRRSLFDVVDPHVEVAVGGPCTLGHLKVFRDLYYTQTETNQPRTPGTATAGNPFTLGADEFFAMGDNSRRSYDGRFWQTVFPALDDLATRRGVVPRRYLLGKAIYVYWPAGYRFTDFIPVPLVPNAGDMRFIR